MNNITTNIFKSRTLFLCLIRYQKKKMSIFVQKLNPITGKCDWELNPENYDYHQEVARSAYADMLHDTERNQKYEQALKIAIDKMHSDGKKANVLDIGTGTGLLAMMAVRNGADTVVACEAFKPMSQCALNILKLNNCQDKIKIIPKRSTELTVGEKGDLQVRLNILVTEVFDTELIGEGALGTFSHAHEVLLEKDCIVIPTSATIYAQVIESPLVQNWNKPKDIFSEDGEMLLHVPSSIKNCRGAAAVHDVQLSQIPREYFNTVISPQPVLRFDWSGNTPFVFDVKTVTNVKAERNGTAQAVFMWWELQMDIERKIILSCAPFWAHPLVKQNVVKNVADIPWRDHWMQAIYYLPNEVDVKKGEEINLISCHDEYSVWFNLKKDLHIEDEDFHKPICECAFHMVCSRTRIGQINSGTKQKKYLSLLENNVHNGSVILILSDGFYLSLCALKFGAKKIYFYEPNILSRKITETYIKFNQFETVEIIDDLNSVKEPIDIVLSEPYFLTSILPWDNLLYIYMLKDVTRLLNKNAKTFPQKAIIKGVAVEFHDLHKIRSSLGNCEGFIMKSFDKLIENSSNISDSNVEAQPLWEYPGVALSKIKEIASFELTKSYEHDYESSGVFVLEGNGSVNGIALWVDWILDCQKNIITTGPILPVEIGEMITWDMHTRQGVCLFDSKQPRSQITYTFTFKYKEGDVNFKFV